MDLEGILLSERSQTQEDMLYNITYMWNLKNTTNEWIKQKEADTDIENKLVVTRWVREVGEGQHWDGRFKRKMRLYVCENFEMCKVL